MNNEDVQRKFIIGDEWSYFKIYTGFKTADALLTDCIYTLATSLEADQIIDKWFFIRYSDPQFHLRLRFHVPNQNQISVLVMRFNQSIKNYVHNNLAWKVQADTYNRELERYGNNTMEASETLFFHNSIMICKLIALDVVKKDEDMRWLAGLKMIDVLLNDFGFSLPEKTALLDTLKENFGKEFGITSEYRHQFGRKYRNEKAKIEKILHPKSEESEEFTNIFEPIFQKSQSLKITIEYIKKRVQESQQLQLNDLLSSYIHMTLNRLFRTQQRKHELVLYDYLYRYYYSMQARGSLSAKENSLK